MADPEPRLDILVADSDSASSAAIAAAFSQSNGVTTVSIARAAEEATAMLAHEKSNALVVDIFSLGVEIGIKLIENTRKLRPESPICLLGTRLNLLALPNVPKSWRSRFGHYYKLVKDQPPGMLQNDAQAMAYKLFTYWLARSAKVRLTNLRAMLLKMESKSTSSILDNRREITEAIDFAQKAIDAQKTQSERIVGIVPGFEARDIQLLVNQTLNRASRALDTSTKINTGILVFGALLVAASFITACVTQRWEAIAFGGFGLAGVVTSLITNPLKSIGITSRQIVQIQVAYLGFLNQISIITECPNDTTDAAMAKSIRLQEATQSIQETLVKNFG